MSQYASKLKKMQGQMKEQMADYTPGGFNLLDEGEYVCRVQATLDESKPNAKEGKTARLTVVWQFVVAEGEKEGKKVFDRTMIEDNKIGAQICRGRLEDLGFTWPENDLPALEGMLEDLTANPPLVEIRVTHEVSEGKAGTKNEGKSFTNARVRVINILENGAAPADGGTADAGAAAAGDPAQDDDPNLATLLALCLSYQLDYVDDSMGVDAIVAALKENNATFKEDDLQPEELACLEAVDEELIERKPVEKAPPARRTVSKPAAPAKAPAKAPARTAAPARGRR